MSTEDIKETDKEVIELLYSSEWPSVVGVGTLPSFKGSSEFGPRGSKSMVNERFDIQSYTMYMYKCIKKKLSEFLTIFLELYLSLQ